MLECYRLIRIYPEKMLITPTKLWHIFLYYRPIYIYTCIFIASLILPLFMSVC